MQFLILVSFYVGSGCASSSSTDSDSHLMNAKNILNNSESTNFSSLEITDSPRELKTMDLDKMNNKINSAIVDYRQSQDLIYLQKAMIIVFSRPDEDSVREKILSSLRSPIDENSAWRSSLIGLAQLAIATMQNEKKTGRQQMAAGLILENILEEIQPEFLAQSEQGGFESDFVFSISEARIEYSEAAIRERKLGLMKMTASPNLIAKRMLEFKNKKKSGKTQ